MIARFERLRLLVGQRLALSRERHTPSSSHEDNSWGSPSTHVLGSVPSVACLRSRRTSLEPKMRVYARRAVLVLSAWIAVVACAAEDGEGRLGADVLDRESFSAPGQVLVRRCGSLDCHGSPYRNYRLFGYGGARLDPIHRPDHPDTTTSELTLNYDATVGVEPERTREIAQGEASVESATLIRKARGVERHVGGQRLIPGSAADTCVVSWWLGALDDRACEAALDELGRPRR